MLCNWVRVKTDDKPFDENAVFVALAGAGAFLPTLRFTFYSYNTKQQIICAVFVSECECGWVLN